MHGVGKVKGNGTNNNSVEIHRRRVEAINAEHKHVIPCTLKKSANSTCFLFNDADLSRRTILTKFSNTVLAHDRNKSSKLEATIDLLTYH